MSNPENTRVLAELFAASPEPRDDAWRQRFYAAAPDATLMLFDPQAALGPDGFPYFQFAIPAPGSANTASVAEALGHCLEQGYGIVIHRGAERSDPPGWVFSYGALLMYAMFGSFEGKSEEPPARDDTPSEGGRQVLLAAPSDGFFPAVAQKAMAKYFRIVLGHTNPKVMMIVDPKEWPANGLMFNLNVNHFDGDEKRFNAQLHALHWYLPESYCAILKMPADWTDESFIPLHSD